jgi:hypothetical protein
VRRISYNGKIRLNSGADIVVVREQLRGENRVKKLACTLLVGTGLGLGGCYYPDPTIGMYSPGGALADKHDGPMILASANEATIAAMFPTGTTRDRVLQTLGAPATSVSNSDGTTAQSFMHTFTSYAQRYVKTEILVVTYDSAGVIKSTSLSASKNTW